MQLGVLPLGKNSGVAYHRLLIPIRKMTEKDPTIKPIIKFSRFMDNIGDDELEELYELGGLCDIIIVQRRYGDRWERMVKAWQDKGVKVVYEIDDIYEHIPVANIDPRYRAMCSRETTKAVGRMLSLCDLITVSTPELGAWARKFTNKQIVWLKNTLDLSMWPVVKKEPSDDVMIGYAGASQHVLDLDVLGGSLHQMHRRHGDKVSFGFMGYIPKDMWNLEELCDAGVYFKAGVPFLEYPSALSNLGYDICLAPAADNIFNSCKSELKYLEYSAMGLPTIASDIPPYRRAIGNTSIIGEDFYSVGKNNRCRGILVKNKPRCFLSAMEWLWSNPEMRQWIGSNARKYVEKNYNIELYVDKWLSTYNELRCN